MYISRRQISGATRTVRRSGVTALCWTGPHRNYDVCARACVCLLSKTTHMSMHARGGLVQQLHCNTLANTRVHVHVAFVDLELLDVQWHLYGNIHSCVQKCWCTHVSVAAYSHTETHKAPRLLCDSANTHTEVCASVQV